ncbi:MAG: vitamin K epoxide reductase family protein [Pseudomonadota bacterium]
MNEKTEKTPEGSFIKRIYGEWKRSRVLPPDQVPAGGPFFCGRAPFVFLIVLGLIGAFASGFLTFRHILLLTQSGPVEQSFLCKADGIISCDAVLLSDYAVLFEYIPSAVLGLMGFAFVLWSTINGLINQRMRKVAWIFLVIYYFVACGFSAYFIYLMKYEVDFVCPWCLVVHVVNYASFGFAIILMVKNERALRYPEISTLAERLYFLFGAVLLPLLVFFSSGMVEKHLLVEDCKQSYEKLSGDIAVKLAVIKSSPTYEVPFSEADPRWGTPNAPHTIVLFSDFQCPVCAKLDALLMMVVTVNPEHLKLVCKHYPLSKECNATLIQDRHPMSCAASFAAQAAFMLGGNKAFWNYAHTLFKNQDRMKENPWTDFARRTKLDIPQFTRLLAEGSPARNKVREDIALGVRLKLTGTPQVFFKGKRIPENNFDVRYLIPILEDLIVTAHPEKAGLKLRGPAGP